ncbi:hypothetical protein GJ496_001159 [Pomphorhynchus laevis]|nr:hypothetical protein GJ496_001159 [Pomphorhynchus laevis]
MPCMLGLRRNDKGICDLSYSDRQVANLVLLARQGQSAMSKILMTGFYTLLMLLRVLFLPQPPYKDPGRHLITHTDVANLISLMNKSSTENCVYFVCMHAIGSAKCNAFAPIFSSLASKFGGEKICKFWKVNVGKCTSNQQKIIKSTFDVDVSTLSTHLPALLVLLNGEVIGKVVPQRSFLSKHYLMTEDNLIRDLQIFKLIDQVKAKAAKNNADDPMSKKSSKKSD